MTYTLTEDRTIATPADLHDSTPRVWLGCLSCYNAGRLVGEWYAAESADLVTPGMVHDDSGEALRFDCEELWIFDHEHLPISGECSPSEAASWGELLEGVDEWQRDAFYAFLTNGDYSHDANGVPSFEEFEERYAGEWDSFEEFAGNLIEETGMLADVPETVARYFDYESFARDLILGGDYTTERAPDFGVYVFATI